MKAQIHSRNLRSAAMAYRDAALSVLPAITSDKRPAIAWKKFQSRLPTEVEIDLWFSPEVDALCIVTGKVSGNLELIDFDNGGELFDVWLASIPDELRDRLVIETSQSGGKHAIYRCTDPVDGNLKLAQAIRGDKLVTLIETRGEGGLFLCAPSAGYEIEQGDIACPPTITAEEREVLLQSAWDLNEQRYETEGWRLEGEKTGSNSVFCSPETFTSSLPRPGDLFNEQGDVVALLKKHGWRLSGELADGNQHWTRPGKTSGTSATLKNRVFYVFSSNASPLEPGRAYSPFALYALLEHGGDFEAAAQTLSDDRDVNLSFLLDNIAESPASIRTLDRLLDEFDGLKPPVIHGLLRQGETMNVIASPKVGKSWFVSALAISVASGMDWLGLQVEQGRVLHIDNELHTCTSAYRYNVISEAMNVPHRLYSQNIDILSLRGKLRNLHSLGQTFQQLQPDQYRLIIIDAFYRTLPVGTDENDNGAIANLYNLIDSHADWLNCAFVLIHHCSKGNQAGKAITDVGAGAGSQSRAADTHLILRPHEEPDTIVMESAVRSWPPLPAVALSWQWPLFQVQADVDTSALAGIQKPKPKSGVQFDDFIATCITAQEPCSKRAIRYEAQKHFELSERKADEMVELAMEREAVNRIRHGSRLVFVRNRAGLVGDKALLTAAIVSRHPELKAQEVAEQVGVTRQYVNQIRRTLDASKRNESDGPKLETEVETRLETDGNTWKPVSDFLETGFQD